MLLFGWDVRAACLFLFCGVACISGSMNFNFWWNYLAFFASVERITFQYQIIRTISMFNENVCAATNARHNWISKRLIMFSHNLNAFLFRFSRKSAKFVIVHLFSGFLPYAYLLRCFLNSLFWNISHYSSVSVRTFSRNSIKWFKFSVKWHPTIWVFSILHIIICFREICHFHCKF